MRKVIGIVGVLALALGFLWLLQGLGLIHVRPILCAANCAEIQGRSALWAIVGFIMIGAGATGAIYGFKKARRS